MSEVTCHLHGAGLRVETPCVVICGSARCNADVSQRSTRRCQQLPALASHSASDLSSDDVCRSRCFRRRRLFPLLLWLGPFERLVCCETLPPVVRRDCGWKGRGARQGEVRIAGSKRRVGGKRGSGRLTAGSACVQKQVNLSCSAQV